MIAVSVFAPSVSLTHAFIDLFIGLYGSGAEMNVMQATLALCAGVWLVGGNGVGGLVGCPSPCSNALPYQDLAHVAQ